MKLLAIILITMSTSAFASTPPEQVDKIDSVREGNLASLVRDYYKQNLKVGCDANANQLVKYESIKLATSSANQEKKLGTPYDYEATYLVLEKCLYGSTFVGAYSDTVKAVAIKASFHSKYNSQGGPAKMEDLKFEVVKPIDVSLPQAQ